MTIEARVRACLPRGVLSPPDLRNAALQRVTYAPAVLGSVELHRVVRVAPIWRPLLTALGREVRVTWRNPGDLDAWFGGELVYDPHPAPASPEIVSCASPRAEAVEALRWVRELIASGRAVARQSGWESSDNQDGHFGGRGEVMIVAARR